MFKKLQFWKLGRLWHNEEKYGTARQGKHDNIIRRVRFECWFDKAIEIHSKYRKRMNFSLQQ